MRFICMQLLYKKSDEIFYTKHDFISNIFNTWYSKCFHEISDHSSTPVATKMQ